MTFLKSFAGFWYDFIVGDGWFVAVGAVCLLVATAALAHAGAQAVVWLLVPLGVALILGISLRRATS
jgi:hypothetical protein